MSNSGKSRNSNISLHQLFPQAVIAASDDILVTSCSRRIRSHCSGVNPGHHIFVTGTDASSDAVSAANKAIAKGATAILTNRLLPISAPQCIVEDVAAAHAKLCHAIRQNPSTKMLTIGVVGSHGKTTAALYVASMLKSVGGSVAYWTTLGATSHGKNETVKEETNPQNLTNWLARAAKNGCPAAVIEISDSMLQSKSSSALEFDVLVVPSLRENQRYDKATTRQLENATLACCQQLKSHGLVVFNADDARLNRWVERNQLPSIGYGLNADCIVRGRKIENTDEDPQLMVTAGRSLMPMQASENQHVSRHMLGAVAVGFAFGLELNEVIGGVERLKKIPGRMQSLPSQNGIRVTIDRADQADRLAVAMHSLQASGRPLTVVAEVPHTATPQQRAAYGRVLSRTAKRVILTQSRVSLNLGQKLAWEVVDGCDRPAEIEIIPNRQDAIELVINQAVAGDQIVLVGMGSESWTLPRKKVALRDDEAVRDSMSKLKPLPVSIPTSAAAIADLASVMRIYNG